MSLGLILAAILEAYVVAIIVWVIASWFPAARSRRELRLLGKVTEPYLKLFRFLPPVGGMDFSPILAILVLQLLVGWVQGVGL